MTNMMEDGATAATINGNSIGPGAKDAPHYMIVSQVKSNRVVYFTDDPEYTPSMEGDWYYVSSFLGELPPQITLRNCWRWRFRGGIFIDAGKDQSADQTKQALIDHNRSALQKILEEKINLVRAPHASACAMGDLVRQKKLAEANAFLANPAQSASYPLVEAAALARNLSMQEAAQLIVAQAAQTDKMLLDTEAVREKFRYAIQQAATEEALLDLREELLNAVFPELTANFKFKTEHTQPPKLDAPLPATQLLHEKVRLQVQLRERINKIRSAHVSQYVLDDVVLKRKARIAEAIVGNGGVIPEKLNPGLLAPYAKARDMSLAEAAKALLSELSQTGKIVIQTEQIKEALLKQIGAIATLRDVRSVAKDIDKL